MKTYNIVLNTVLTVAGLGSLYYIFEPNFSLLERLLLGYIVYVCVFILYMNYKFTKIKF